MITAEQATVLRAKPDADRTPEEVADLAAFDQAQAVAEQKKKTDNEHMIPKSRLDEALKKAKDAQEALDALKTQQTDAERKRLEAEKNYEALYQTEKAEKEALKTKADGYDGMEKSMQATLDAQIALIPEAKRSLVPAYGSVQDRLDFIRTNLPLLSAPAAMDIGAGRQGGAEDKSVTLSAEELAFSERFGEKPADYQKNK